MHNRKFHLAVSLGVFALAALGLFGLLYWQDARLSASVASDRLDTVQQVQRLVAEQQRDDLTTRAQLIAGNQAVTSYVAQALGGSLPGMEIDRVSIVDLLEERRDQLGLTLAAVLDLQGHLVATTERFSADREFGDEPLFVAARDSGMVQSGLWVDRTRLLLIAIQPLADYGFSEAFLLVAVPVNQAQAETIAGIGNTGIALVADTADGPLIAGSTLVPAQQPDLLAALPAGAAESERRLDARLDGSRYRMSVSPLFGSTTARMVALVGARADASSFVALRLPVAIAGILVLLGIAFASHWLWTRVLAPANGLADMIERAAGTGDRFLTAPEAGAAPIRRLAAAFNRLAALSARRRDARTRATDRQPPGT